MYVPDNVRRVAVAMCDVDGLPPYTQVPKQNEGGYQEAWTQYIREAKLFLAGMRALTDG